ncbi:MAG: WGxxGxxG family protein [Longimicrobiales bacterium]
MRYLEIKRLLGSIVLALSLAVSGAALPAVAVAQEPAQPGVIEETEEVEGVQRGMQRGEARGSNLGWLGLLGLLGLIGLRGRQHHATRVDTTATRRAA